MPTPTSQNRSSLQRWQCKLGIKVLSRHFVFTCSSASNNHPLKTYKKFQYITSPQLDVHANITGI